MPLARIGSTILFFAHIPKTGGSSVERYLAKTGSLALSFPRRLGWSASTAQHMEAQIHTRLVPDGFFDMSFAIMRDPVARAVSEYRYRADRSGKRPDFDTWVERHLEALSDRPYLNDNHLRPQVEFLRPGMALFLLEHGLDPVFDWIDAVTGAEPGPRDLWQKKSASPPVEVSDRAERRLRDFYAADDALVGALKDCAVRPAILGRDVGMGGKPAPRP